MNENPPSSFSGKLQIMCDGTHAEDAAVTKKSKEKKRQRTTSKEIYNQSIIS